MHSSSRKSNFPSIYQWAVGWCAKWRFKKVGCLWLPKLLFGLFMLKNNAALLKQPLRVCRARGNYRMKFRQVFIEPVPVSLHVQSNGIYTTEIENNSTAGRALTGQTLALRRGGGGGRLGVAKRTNTRTNNRKCVVVVAVALARRLLRRRQVVCTRQAGRSLCLPSHPADGKSGKTKTLIWSSGIVHLDL